MLGSLYIEATWTEQDGAFINTYLRAMTATRLHRGKPNDSIYYAELDIYVSFCLSLSI